MQAQRHFTLEGWKPDIIQQKKTPSQTYGHTIKKSREAAQKWAANLQKS